MGAGAIRPPFYFRALRGPPMRATRPQPMIDRAVRPIARTTIYSRLRGH